MRNFDTTLINDNVNYVKLIRNPKYIDLVNKDALNVACESSTREIARVARINFRSSTLSDGKLRFTDDPPPEVETAGHDRCISPLNPRTSTPGSHRIQAGVRSCARSSPTASGHTTSTSSLRKLRGRTNGYRRRRRTGARTCPGSRRCRHRVWPMPWGPPDRCRRAAMAAACRPAAALSGASAVPIRLRARPET